MYIYIWLQPHDLYMILKIYNEIEYKKKIYTKHTYTHTQRPVIDPIMEWISNR